jgi:hypothetical protein
MALGKSVNMKQATVLMKMYAKAKKPTLIRSRHGVGKSQLVYEIAEEFGLPVVERRLSQLTEGEMTGLPFMEGESTKFKSMDWYKECCNGARVLFFDEIDRASDENRQATFQIMDSRTFNGEKLHPDTIIFAAINGGKHSTNYRVRTMDPAELSRYAVIDIDPDADTWIRWAKENPNRIHALITEFITENQSMLFHSGDQFEPNKVYPCPRSWERLSDVLKANKLLDFVDAPDPVVELIGNSFIGDIAQPFYGFLRNSYQNYDWDALLSGKYKKAYNTDSFKYKATSLLLGKMPYYDRLLYVDDRKISDKEVANLAEFFLSIENAEHFITFLVKICETLSQMKSDNDKQTIEDKIYASAFYRMFSLEMKTPLDKDGELKNTLSEYTSRKLDTLKISETDLTKIQEEMKKTDEEVARKVAEAAAAKTENTAVAAPKKKK